MTLTDRNRLSEPGSRAALGSLLRCVLDFLDEKGIREKVRARVPPATAQLIDAPPWPFAWVPAVHIDQIEIAIMEQLGRAGCVELGLAISRSLGGGMIQPVIRAAFFIFGESPPTVFANLDRFFALTTRGISFSWRTLDRVTGEVLATFDGAAVPSAAFHVLQGSLEYVFELTGGPGTVGGAEIRRQDPLATAVAYVVSLGG